MTRPSIYCFNVKHNDMSNLRVKVILSVMPVILTQHAHALTHTLTLKRVLQLTLGHDY